MLNLYTVFCVFLVGMVIHISNTMPFLQHVVQSLTETCPVPPPELETDYVLNEEPVPLQCCKKIVPVACRVGDNIYKVTNIPHICLHVFLKSSFTPSFHLRVETHIFQNMFYSKYYMMGKA